MATVEKYLRDVRAAAVTKEAVDAYKKQLQKDHAPHSVNSILAGVNSFLALMGWTDCKAKLLKLRRQVTAPRARS